MVLPGGGTWYSYEKKYSVLKFRNTPTCGITDIYNMNTGKSCYLLLLKLATGRQVIYKVNILNLQWSHLFPKKIITDNYII